MEKRGVSSSVLMVCLVLGVLLGQSTSATGDFIILPPNCYTVCLVGCYLDGNDVDSWAPKCLGNCLLPKLTVGLKDTQTFCKLGCATALCSKISTKANIAEKKVASCAWIILQPLAPRRTDHIKRLW